MLVAARRDDRLPPGSASMRRRIKLLVRSVRHHLVHLIHTITTNLYRHLTASSRSAVNVRDALGGRIARPAFHAPNLPRGSPAPICWPR